MAIDLKVGTNAKQLIKKLERFQNTELLKVKSKAAEQAARAGAVAMAKDGQNAIDDPIKAIFNGKRAKNRVGWIYFEWDNRADIKKKGGNTDAKIQLQGFGKPKNRAEQQEAMHRQIYGTTEREGVTPAAPFIIKPSKKLLKEKKIKGCPLKIDSFGNLRNYRKNMTKMMSQPEKFFQVKLGETSRANGKYKLEPGLYMRVLRVRRYKRNKHTKRKGGPYGGGGKKKAALKIITILRYHTVRKFKPKWDFKEKARDAMRKKYKDAFLVELQRAINKEKPLNPSGSRSTGNLL